jgi:sugar phosphate isomerase/epimerase
MHVEASINPPRDQADSARFEQDVQNAQAAGASLARTVLFPGRRYENFKSVEEFRRAEAAALKSLQLAEPIIARRRFRLAVENHKDQRMPERLELLKRLSSEFIGLCVDVGNNFTLMEDPLDTVRAFAPWAFTVHFKDHAVREYEDGFLFSDVALGDGFLDLPALVKVLRDARKDVRFNLESITRDPLKVPVLTDTYWATLPETPPREFARTLRVVKANARSEPFPLVSKLTQAEQLELERRTVERSIAYARDKLSL